MTTGIKLAFAAAALLLQATSGANAQDGGAPLQNAEAWRAPNISCFNGVSDPRLWDETIVRLRVNEPSLETDDIRILLPTAKVMVLEATGDCNTYRPSSSTIRSGR